MAADTEALVERLRTVERALVDGDPPESIAEAAELAARVEDLEAGLEDLTERVLTLEATVQALRGFAGQVRHVNREVERRAEAALATVEAMEGNGGLTDASTAGGSVGAAEPDGEPGAGGEHRRHRERPPTPDHRPADGAERPAGGPDGEAVRDRRELELADRDAGGRGAGGRPPGEPGQCSGR